MIRVCHIAVGRIAFLAVFLFAVANCPAGGAIRVACVGDSITYGSRLQDRTNNAYPVRLGHWLGTDYDVRNFGVSGATLLHQANKPYFKESAYTNALAFHPDILVINLGANDSKHPGEGSLDATNAVDNWQYHASYVGDYEEMIAAFRQRNPAVKVFVCFPTPDFPGRWGINDRTILEEMIPLIRTVAADTRATIIDLHAALTNQSGLFPDTVHPNDAGAKVMAAAIYRSLTGEPPPDAPAPVADLLLNRRVLWLGDSITQDGKYVSFVQYYLEKKYPAAKFDFISIGLASETVSGLSERAHPFPRPCVFERLQRALDATKPVTVIACYGMNDGIYHPSSPERMQAFQAGIHRLSQAVKAAGAQLILLTPPPFDPLPVKGVVPANAPDFSFMHPYTNYDSVLTEYAAWELALPVAEARLVVDLHAPLADYLAIQRAQNPRFSFTKDGIHPAASGHLLMARTILTALGVATDTGDLDDTLKTVEADPLFPLVRSERELRSGGWLAYVGYTRNKTVKSASVTDVEQSVADLQAQADKLRR